MGAFVAIEVFAEKFRGFEKIHLTLTNSTFVTGDNSSGKSSILLLLDYIIKSELNDEPELSSELVTDRYDFFSPYFNFSDVTIGFIGRGKKRVAGKVITIKRRPRGYSPKVVRMTWVDANARTTIKCTDRSVSYKITDGVDDLNVDSLLALHRETTGYKSLSVDEDEILFGANSPALLFAAIREYGGSEKISRSIFVSTRMGNLPNVRHSGPVRGLPEPFYHFDRHIKATGAHFASMWHDMSHIKNSTRLDQVNRFGKESGLFDEITVEKISSKMTNSPMLVKIKKNEKEFLLGQVGVGVSQVIPIIVESIFESNSPEKGFLLLQQPELHLHPVAQAALGEFLYSMNKEKVLYVIETHSDFLIDRFRSMMREDGTPPSAQILFCENTEEGNKATVIEIEKNGEIKDAPENYKEFFVNELLRTMF